MINSDTRPEQFLEHAGETIVNYNVKEMATEDMEGNTRISYNYMSANHPSTDRAVLEGYLAKLENVSGKVNRADSVEAIKVTTLAGNEFDGNETSQTRMSRAIAVMNDTDTIMWILANDEAIMVGKAEMMEALKLASAEQTRLWVL